MNRRLHLSHFWLTLTLMSGWACSESHSGGPDGSVSVDSGVSADSGLGDAATSDADTDGAAPAECAAQDVSAEGDCEAVVGVFWWGAGCVTLSGCKCVGEDCDAAFESVDACIDAHADCERSCGGHVLPGYHTRCRKGEFCDYELNEICGAADAPGTCAEMPTACDDVYQPVCGCDRKTYGNACEANAAGTAVASEEKCP